MKDHITALPSGIKFDGILTPCCRITLPQHKKLNLSVADLFALMENLDIFIRGDIDLPESLAPIRRLAARCCSVYQLNRQGPRRVVSHLIYGRKLFFNRQYQLLAHLLLAVKEGIIPLPNLDDTGKMFFPYARKLDMSIDIWSITLTPVNGVWKIDDVPCTGPFYWGDAYCVFS